MHVTNHAMLIVEQCLELAAEDFLVAQETCVSLTFLKITLLYAPTQVTTTPHKTLW
jgi:hypothetical protein